MNTKTNYVQFGSGDVYIDGWKNYDASPTLYFQRFPFIGRLLRRQMNVEFDKRILYGDIVRGLPELSNNVDGLFCSHVLEHLTLDDFHTALSNCFNLLKPGGRFRLIVPNLDFYINQYCIDKGRGLNITATNFMKNTHLGRQKSRVPTLKKILEGFSNQHHQWMWNKESLVHELINHGFVDVRSFKFGNSDDLMFLRPEREYQFSNEALAIECFKPL